MPLKEKKLHIVTEFIAVFILTPYFINFLYRYDLDKKNDIMIKLIIIGTILVDGFLLTKWLR